MSPVWTAIIATGIATFAMRASFLVVATRLVEVPPPVQRLLRQIPPAALAALVLPALVRPEGSLDLLHPQFAAGALAAVVAWRTKSATLTLLVGMIALIALERI